MDLQPIDDPNDDCPNYGGSPITLPPDDNYGPLSESLQMPQAWHQFGWIKEQLWKVATGKGIKVAVLDTGYSKHKYGPEPVAARSFINGQSWQDGNGHGTHCAGTVLCRRDEQGNSIGLAPDAELIVGKVLSNEGSGSSGGIAAGVRWAADQGAHVISMSLGGGGPDTATNQAIDYAWAKGCIVNAAAGNAGYNGSNTIGWPAKYANCLCCGAYAENGGIANFSSGGRELDWACPGSNVISFSTNGSGFRTMSGTCIAEGSYVYGPSGPKKIETIQPGDVVYAWKDGEMVERVVVQNHYRGTADTFVLNANGRDVRLTPTHQVLTFNVNDRDYEWVEAQNISADNHRALLPRQFSNQINPYLDRILDAEFCWLLGFFAGDGWISYTSRGMRSCFADKGDTKRDILNRVAEIYQKTTGKSLSRNKNGNWHYDDSTMTAMIIECLGFHEPSQTKNFPLWLWNLPKSKQVEFYKGYVASDGSRKKNLDDAIAFECTSKDLIRRIAIAHDYWGVKHGRCRTREREIQAPNSKSAKWMRTHSINTNSSSVNEGGWGFLRSKTKSGEENAKGYGVNIDSFYTSKFNRIEEVETCRVYDLTVPDADCFVTQGVITHNSMACPGGSALLGCVTETRLMQGLPLFTSAQQVRDYFAKSLKDAGSPGFDVRFGLGRPDGNFLVNAILKDLVGA